MDFSSDNSVGAAPEILDAIVRANAGSVPSYGGDDLTQRVTNRFREIFDKDDLSVFFVLTGGAANGLALSVLTPPYGMVLAHQESHIQMDECAGPEFFTGGAKILPMEGYGGKVLPETVIKTLAGFPERPPHGAPARVLSLTQATECGSVYTAAEIASLGQTARANGLALHMDGARFANAVVSTGADPADLTWRAGVDALSFGATKNGCIAAEAVIFFDPQMADDFAFKRKRAGQLLSKARFLAAQFDAYLHDDLWLSLARKANNAASYLSDALARIDGVTLWYPTDANEVFVSFPDGVVPTLMKSGARFYPWVTPGDPADGKMYRLICSFQTDKKMVDTFVATVRMAINNTAP